MRKFNRKFNNLCVGFSLWEMLVRELANFERLLKPECNLSSEDLMTLKKIHAMLYECSQNAKERREVYLSKMENLRKEVGNDL